jgi:hypothetical protein
MKVFAWLGAAFITWMVLFAVALGAALDGTIQAAEPEQAPLVVADIPSDYLVLYQQAADRYHLDWAILAAIGRVETNHGQSGAVGVHPPSTNFHGCCAGPMQFCVIDGCPAQGPTSLTVDEAQAGTWRAYGVDGNHDGVKDPWDPHDAIPAAAKYLKASGAPGDYHHAVLSYNASEDYYANVVTQAAEYRAAATSSPSLTDRDIIVEADRMISLNQPYTWGGGHLTFDADGPWDCSGAVSYLLHYLGLLNGSPLTSGALMSVGQPGRGSVFTIYANTEHVFLIIESGRHKGDAWGTATRDLEGAQGSGPLWHHHGTGGFVARHYSGW